jgi:hypothetical protein
VLNSRKLLIVGAETVAGACAFAAKHFRPSMHNTLGSVMEK